MRPVQRWPEDGMRDVQVIFSQVQKGDIFRITQNGVWYAVSVSKWSGV